MPDTQPGPAEEKRPPPSRIRVIYDLLPTILAHLALLAIPFVAPTTTSIALMVVVALTIGFGVTVGLHRYFSHRAFKTSRWFQFVLGCVGTAAGQRGPLWWAAHHRRHHSHSDTEADVHSPTFGGFLHAHIGWLFSRDAVAPDYRTVRDFSRYPELVWLDRYPKLPVLATATLCFLIGGWAGLIYGYCLASVLVKQSAYSVNSFGHLFGPQPYATGDTSRNNWVLGLIALGDGWHNNHHHSPRTARHGFKWYEIDPSYYLILTLEAIGVVWGVKKTPRPPRAKPDPEPVTETVGRDRRETVAGV